MTGLHQAAPELCACHEKQKTAKGLACSMSHPYKVVEILSRQLDVGLGADSGQVARINVYSEMCNLP